MPTIPYKPLDIEEPRELVAAIRARRGGTLLNLDRMLLYSPAFAKGWNSFLGAVRNELTLPPRLRELAICTVAVLNDADYEFIQHAPVFLQAGGTEQQLAALRQIGPSWSESEGFSADELAAIQLAIEMTRAVKVSDTTMERVRSCLLNDQQLVELVGVIATYNMVSRYLVALGIEPE